MSGIRSLTRAALPEYVYASIPSTGLYFHKSVTFYVAHPGAARKHFCVQSGEHSCRHDRINARAFFRNAGSKAVMAALKGRSTFGVTPRTGCSA